MENDSKNLILLFLSVLLIGNFLLSASFLLFSSNQKRNYFIDDFLNRKEYLFPSVKSINNMFFSFFEFIAFLILWYFHLFTDSILNFIKLFFEINNDQNESFQSLVNRKRFASAIDVYNLVILLFSFDFYFLLPMNLFILSLFIYRLMQILLTSLMMIMESGLKEFKDYSYSLSRNIIYFFLNIFLSAIYLSYIFIMSNPCYLIKENQFDRSSILYKSILQLITFNGFNDFDLGFIRIIYLMTSVIYILLTLATVTGFKRLKYKYGESGKS